MSPGTTRLANLAMCTAEGLASIDKICMLQEWRSIASWEILEKKCGRCNKIVRLTIALVPKYSRVRLLQQEG
jgi:hypothetical protein